MLHLCMFLQFLSYHIEPNEGIFPPFFESEINVLKKGERTSGKDPSEEGSVGPSVTRWRIIFDVINTPMHRAYLIVQYIIPIV